MAVLRFIGSLVAGVIIGLAAIQVLATFFTYVVFRGPDPTLGFSFICGTAIGAYSARIILRRISASAEKSEETRGHSTFAK